MRMMMLFAVYGPHASSIRPIRLSTRPVLPALWPVAEPGGKGRGLPPRCGTWPPLYTRLPRGSQPGVLDRVFAPRHRAPSVRLTRAARSPARPLVKVPPAGPRARTQPAPPPSAAPGAAGPPRCRGVPRALARARPRRPGGPPVARSPGPAPRSSRGDEGPGVRARPAAAPGRGAGVYARGAAAAKPGRAWGVYPGAVHAAHRKRAGVASLAGMPSPLLSMRATRRASPRMHRLRTHHQCVAVG